MKKTLIYFCLLLITLTMACKKEGLKVFEDSSASNSIYFPLAEKSNNLDFSYGYVKPHIQDSVLKIVVRTVGGAMNRDRKYNLSIADSTTLKSGVDYQFLNTEFAIKAGTVADTLRIKLNRTALMKQDSLFLYMDLKANENFSNQLLNREETVEGVKVTRYYTRLRLKVDDIAGVPWFWGVGPGATFYNSYLGKFGTNKFQLLLAMFDLDVEEVVKVNYNPETARVFGWTFGMKSYLDRMTAEGTPVYETDGSLMKMGSNAN